MMFKNRTQLTSIKSLSFGYSTGTMINSSVSYYLHYENDKYTATIKPNGVSEDEAIYVNFKDEDVERITKVLNKYNIQKWDGFNKYDKNVLDGNSFNFTVFFKDNTSIRANGYMRYPDKYKEVKEEIDTIFLSYYEDDE